MNSANYPVLYSFRRCPYAMRARLALVVSGTQCELREVSLSNKPSEMLSASPKGTVPAMRLPDGTVLEESLDIMRWALSLRDPEGWLDRDDPVLIESCDGPFKRDLDRYKYPERLDCDPAAHRQSAVAFLLQIDDRLACSGELGGPTRGLADAAVMPFVRQFAAVDRQWFDAQPFTHLQRWLARHLVSDLFTAIMVRVTPWSPGDAPLYV